MAKFVLTAQLQLQAPSNVKQVVDQIQSQFNGIKAQVDIQGAAKANKQISSITKSATEASDAATRMGKSFSASVRRFSAMAIATRAVSLFTNTLSGAIKQSIDFERELVKISQVTGKSISQLNGLTKTIFSLSTTLGVSSQSLLSVSRILAQTGLSAQDTQIALSTLAKTELAPTFDDITQTAEGAVAILNQFGQGARALEAQLGSLNAVAGQFAVEAGDLISVIRRTGGVFKAAGGDINELIALFTSVRATTRESAESIATGLRTIFTRIQRPETIEYLRQFGVELTDLEGKFVGPYKAIELLSKALSGLGERDLTFVQIAEQLGGFRQIGKVLPLLQQFAVAQDALKAATEGSNSLTSDAAKAQAALAIQIMRVKEEFFQLINKVTSTSTFQIMADTVLDLASALIKLGDALAPIIPLLTAFAGIKATQGIFKAGAGIAKGLGFNEGGKVLAFARGGSVPGVGNRDTVPAMLTPGEFVMRKSSAQKIGANNLKRMNEGGKAQEKPEKNFGKIGFRSTTGGELTATYLGNKDRSGMVSARYNDGLYTVSLSKATSGYGPMLYDVVMELATSNGSMLAPDRNQISKDAQGVWGYYFNNRNDVTKHPLDPSQWTKNQSLIDPKLYGKKETWPPKTDPAWILQSGYKKQQRIITDPNRAINLNDPKYTDFIRQSQMSYMSPQQKHFGGIIQKFETGTTARGARRKGGRSQEEVAAMVAEQGIDTSSPSALRGQKRGDQRKGERLNKTFGLAALYGVRDSAPQDTVLPVTGNIVKTQYGVLDEAVSKKYEDQMRSSVATTATNIASDLMRNIGSKPKPPGDVDSLLDKAGLSNAVGTFFESALALTGAPYEGGSEKSQINDSIDFPTGLGAVASQFGLPSNIPTDATRTSGSKGKGNVGFAAQVERFLFRTRQLQKPLNFATGGVVPGTGNRDTVPATLQAGDFVIRKSSVNSIGAGNLQKMAGYNSGGKTSDVPALLTPGEFVFSKGQAQKVGYGKLNRMNKVGKYAKGGIVQRFAGGTGPTGAQPSGSGSVGVSIDTSALTTALEGLVGGIQSVVTELETLKSTTSDNTANIKENSEANQDNTDTTEKNTKSSQSLIIGIIAFNSAISMLTPTIDESSGYFTYLANELSTLGMQAASLYGILEQFGALDIANWQKLGSAISNMTGKIPVIGETLEKFTSGVGKGFSEQFGKITKGSKDLATQFTGLGKATQVAAAAEAAETTANKAAVASEALETSANKAGAAMEGVETAVNASAATTEAVESTMNVASATTEGVEATASGVSAAADLVEAGASLLAAGPLGVVVGVVLAVVAALAVLAAIVGVVAYAMNSAAAEFAKAKKEAAIEAGNVEEAGKFAEDEARANQNIDLIFAPLSKGIEWLNGDLELLRRSAVAAAKAEAQLVKAAEAVEKGNKKTAEAITQFDKGLMSAGEALAVSSSAAQEVVNSQRRVAEANMLAQKSVVTFASSLGSFLKNLTFGMTSFGLPTIEENQMKADQEIKDRNARQKEQERSVISANQPLTNALAKQVAAAGGSIEDFYQKLRETNEPLYNLITSSSESSEAMETSFQNIAKEVDRATKAFEAMNLGLQNVQAAAGALTVGVDNLMRGIDSSTSMLENSIATLEAGVTNAAQGMSDTSWNNAMADATSTLKRLGGEDEAINKFSNNLNAINAMQKKYANASEEVRAKLMEDLKDGRGGQGTAVQRKDLLADALVNQIPDDLGPEIKESMKDAIRGAEISDDDMNKIMAGDMSALDKVLKDLGDTTLEQVLPALKQMAEIENKRLNIVKELVSLEEKLIDAKMKAIDVEIESREYIDDFGGKSFEEPERRQLLFEKGNVRNVTSEGKPIIPGMPEIRTGSRQEFEARNEAAVRAGREVSATRAAAQQTDETGAFTPEAIAAQREIRTEEFQNKESSVNQFAQEELGLKRELVKSIKAEIKAIEAKEKAEKKAADALLSGSYEQFIEELSGIGAAAAVASGDQRLMNAYSRKAYGKASQNLEDQKAAGVKTVYGQDIDDLNFRTRRTGLTRGGLDARFASDLARAGTQQSPKVKRLNAQGIEIAESMRGTADVDTAIIKNQIEEQRKLIKALNSLERAIVQNVKERTKEANEEKKDKKEEDKDNSKNKSSDSTSSDASGTTPRVDSERVVTPTSRTTSDGCCDGVSDVRVVNTGDFPQPSDVNSNSLAKIIANNPAMLSAGKRIVDNSPEIVKAIKSVIPKGKAVPDTRPTTPDNITKVASSADEAAESGGLLKRIKDSIMPSLPGMDNLSKMIPGLGSLPELPNISSIIPNLGISDFASGFRSKDAAVESTTTASKVAMDALPEALDASKAVKAGASLSKGLKAAMNVLGPVADVADVVVGGYTGATRTEETRGNLSIDRGLDDQNTLYKTGIGVLTGTPTLGGSVTSELSGLVGGPQAQVGGTADVAMAGTESVLRGAAIGATAGSFVPGVGTLVGAGVGGAVGGTAELVKATGFLAQDAAAAREASGKTERMRQASIDDSGLDVRERSYARQEAQLQSDLEAAKGSGDSAEASRIQGVIDSQREARMQKRREEQSYSEYFTGASVEDSDAFKQQVQKEQEVIKAQKAAEAKAAEQAQIESATKAESDRIVKEAKLSAGVTPESEAELASAVEAKKKEWEEYDKKTEELKKQLDSTDSFLASLPDPSAVSQEKKVEQTAQITESTPVPAIQSVPETPNIVEEQQYETDEQMRARRAAATPEELAKEGIKSVYTAEDVGMMGDQDKIGTVKEYTPEYLQERDRINAESYGVSPEEYKKRMSEQTNIFDPAFDPQSRDMSTATPSQGYAFSDALNYQLGVTGEEATQPSMLDAQNVIAENTNIAPAQDVLPAPPAPGEKVASPESSAASTSKIESAMSSASDAAKSASEAASEAKSAPKESGSADATAAGGTVSRPKAMSQSDAGSCCSESLTVLKQILEAIKGGGVNVAGGMSVASDPFSFSKTYFEPQDQKVPTMSGKLSSKEANQNTGGISKLLNAEEQQDISGDTSFGPKNLITQENEEYFKSAIDRKKRLQESIKTTKDPELKKRQKGYIEDIDQRIEKREKNIRVREAKRSEPKTSAGSLLAKFKAMPEHVGSDPTNKLHQKSQLAERREMQKDERDTRRREITPAALGGGKDDISMQVRKQAYSGQTIEAGMKNAQPTIEQITADPLKAKTEQREQTIDEHLHDDKVEAHLRRRQTFDKTRNRIAAEPKTKERQRQLDSQMIVTRERAVSMFKLKNENIQQAEAQKHRTRQRQQNLTQNQTARADGSKSRAMTEKVEQQKEAARALAFEQQQQNLRARNKKKMPFQLGGENQLATQFGPRSATPPGNTNKVPGIVDAATDRDALVAPTQDPSYNQVPAITDALNPQISAPTSIQSPATDMGFDNGNLSAVTGNQTPDQTPIASASPMAMSNFMSSTPQVSQSSMPSMNLTETNRILTSIESVLKSIDGKQASTSPSSSDSGTLDFDGASQNFNSIFTSFTSELSDVIQRLENVQISINIAPVNVVVQLNGGGVLSSLKQYVQEELWSAVQSEIASHKLGNNGSLQKGTSTLPD